MLFIVAVVALGMVGFAGVPNAAAVDVYLQAQSLSKALPDGLGGTVPVPMWGFVCDPAVTAIDNPNCVPSAAGSPMPRIDVAPGDSLTIHLTNTLPTPVSIVIPGQAGGGDPVPFTDTRGRVRVQSFTHETAAGATTAVTYTWNSLRPGTYLYQSGTHPSIQVPMGLYGALVVGGPATLTTGSCATGQPAYDSDKSCYDADAVLLFSEIDPWQNQRVADATAPLTTACVTLAAFAEFGTTNGYPCTVDYNADYFLVNGETSAALPAGDPGDNVLLRFLNAGSRSHTPAIVGRDMGLIAEDGNPYPGLVKLQSEALLPAGKTLDVLVAMPAEDVTFALFDRMPSGGTLANLVVGTGSTPPTVTLAAVPDTYTFNKNTPLFGANVLANDIGLAGATVALSGLPPVNGTLVLNPNGTFTYTTTKKDVPFVDTFTYTATLGTTFSSAAVTLNVDFTNGAPVARDDAYVNAIGSTITVAAPGVLGNDSDPDGDALTAVTTLVTQPAIGTVTLASDGSFTYTDGTPGTPVTFSYNVTDGTLTSADNATVTLTINPVANIALTVRDPLGAAVTDYRWLVQEDATYHVNPNSPLTFPDDSDKTQSLNFHKSYMPVVAQGCVQPSIPCEQVGGVNVPVATFDNVALDPLKHYYVSVLPNDAGTGEGHTIGGAQIPAPVIPSTTFSPVTVIVNNQPIPTAQISVLVFEDNAPTNGVPEPNEPRLGGFQITLEDAGGRYGISGGTMSQDAFGNPLKNSLDCFGGTPPPMGVILTCPDGTALIKDLPPGKYGVIAVAPLGPDTWTQTSTIEGTKVIDAWVKAGEPPFFLEFGAAGPHAFIGFVNPAHTCIGPANGATSCPVRLPNGNPTLSTITGAVTLLHDPRPPGLPGTSDTGSYAGLAHTRAWVGLNTIAGDGPSIATVRAEPAGSFSISGIPNGTYQLVVWDDYLDQVIAFQVVTVAGANINVGNVPVNNWFTRLEHNVFLDDGCGVGGAGIAGDGIRQDCEVGLPEQAVNIRWRDGTVNQTFPTDMEGFVPFDQVFPFFAWQVAEVDYTRFKPTGVTVTVDNGGLVDSSNILYPQLQSGVECTDASCLSRTEQGPTVLLEAFQGFPGQTSIFNWGKVPYNPGENGGISGIVFYGSTRGENDPRLTVGDPWERGIPGVKVRLYREVARSDGGTALALMQEIQTDSWDASVPTGCPGEDPASPFTIDTLGTANLTRCYDGWRNWNQVRPGVFDGGYAFNDILPGKYVVEVVPPPGFELIKEEDVNVGFGDGFAPVAPPADLPVFIFPDAATVAAALAPEPGIAQPPCVGDLREVPLYLSLFPSEMIPAPFPGALRPLCNRKQVILSDQGQAAADFHLFTTTPIAAQFAGLITDDISSETDPRSPGYGEKWSPAFLPFSIRDFKGQEVYRGYGDAFGRYNGVLPSTFTANIPIPSGYSPAMMAVCLNDPGDGLPDPWRLPSYGTACYTMQFMPGTTTYLDTPVLPNAAFAAGYNPVDCARTDGTPKIMQVDGTGAGPLVAPGGTLTIQSAGTAVSVPNPDYQGPLSGTPVTITRDFSFGDGGSVTLVNAAGVSTPLTDVVWGVDTITGTVPNTLAGPYQLVVTRANGNSSINTVTVTVGTEVPIRVGPGLTYTTIQAAIDEETTLPGSLILVEPNTSGTSYNEQVVMWKPVRLQGSGAATIINALQRPAEKLQAWIDKVTGLVLDGWVDLLPGQVDLATEQGAGVTVLAKQTGLNRFNLNPSRIDGFTITGGEGGGGIFVNGYAHNLVISNNDVTGNSGNLHGGMRVGHPFLALVGDGPFAFNTGVDIHHNAVTLNGARHFESAGGGVSLSSGTDNYRIRNNFVCGNFTAGDGAGIGHLGRSDNGQIAFNKILFNQSVNAGLNQHGGGIVIEGVAAEPPALTLGTGNVTVDANLIQGNQAGSGHGGGIRTQLVNGRDVELSPNQNNWHRVTITNNMIVNNVAAYSGAGISLQDTANGSIVLNTIANNDSTATGGGLIVGTVSLPQPAGISSELNSLGLNTAIPGNSPQKIFSNPTLTHNIVWHNRAFHYEGTPVPALQPVLTPASVGECPEGAVYYDLGVLDPGQQLSPQRNILTSLTGFDGKTYPSNGNSANSTADPQLVNAYCNAGRGLSAPLGPMLATAAFGEGGNFLDVRYGPLTKAWPADSPPWNYHIQSTSPAIDATGTQPANVSPFNHDFDNQIRPLGPRVDRGADEVR